MSSALFEQSAGAVEVPSYIQSAIRDVAWAWFRAHPDLVILRRKVLIFSVSITVAQLRPLFELLFGAEPATTRETI